MAPGIAQFAAVGDLLLRPAPAGAPYRRDFTLLASDVRDILATCDIRFGNLEFTLPGDGGHVPTEPRVVGEPAAIRAVAAAGFNVLTLANNHMFDCLDGGFRQTRALLDELAIPYLGAGMDLAEAAAPAIVTANGVRVAFLAAVDERSGPHQFADAAGRWGVAPLDIARLSEQIRELRTQVHHVVVSLHWGEERFLIPAPAQIEQARALVDAGASLILGHHPHVLQGLEFYRGAPIIYSLGNFVADEVYFSDGDALRWNRTERTGCILLAELHENAVVNVRQTPCFDAGDVVALDHTGFGARRIAQTNRALSRGVTPARYRREHFRIKTIRPILSHLRWSELLKLRPRHFAKALRLVCKTPRAE